MAKVKKTKGPKVYEGVDGMSADMDGMPGDATAKMMAMLALAHLGVAPEEYADFLQHTAELRKMFNEVVDGDDERGFRFGKGHLPAPPAIPLAGAECKTLRLKVQMNDVTKPPMWREIEVPADFTFAQLHYAIQAAMGLENAHLWQFQHKAYNPDLQIGIPQSEEFSFGLDEWTHNADETPVTAFLAEKGDKLEYVYDFGDDWIFTVSVLGLTDRENEVAVCKKWKSEFQPIENCGGVWTYLQLRDIVTNWPTMKPKQKKDAASQFYFDNSADFEGWFDEHLIDIEFVNEQLAEIPDKWEDID